jgi:hypothetical protein
MAALKSGAGRLHVQGGAYPLEQRRKHGRQRGLRVAHAHVQGHQVEGLEGIALRLVQGVLDQQSGFRLLAELLQHGGGFCTTSRYASSADDFSRRMSRYMAEAPARSPPFHQHVARQEQALVFQVVIPVLRPVRLVKVMYFVQGLIAPGTVYVQYQFVEAILKGRRGMHR